jgi:hypothetical protein
MTQFDPASLLVSRSQSADEGPIIRMSQRARELRAGGMDLVSLTLGEPDFDTVGFRFGVQIRAGSRAIVTGGIRRELQVPVCYLKGCSSWTPELGVSFIF